MKRLFLALSCLLLTSIITLGQINPSNNQYVLNPMSINPAFSGGRGALNLATFYGKQWVGVAGAPTTLTFSIDAPLADQKLGIGLMVISDKVGVTKENQILSSYSYKINMDNSVLSFGLGAGIILTNTAYSDLIVLDPGDEIYMQDTRTYAVPSFSFGIHYQTGQFFAGLSIPKFLNYSFNFSKNKYVLDNDFSRYSYLLNSGYTFNAGEKIKIFPSVLLRHSSIPADRRFSYDINAHIGYIDKFWLGGSYRNNRTFATLFQFQPNNQLKIAYTYNFEVSQLGKYSNGSHEIMLRYQFTYKLDALNPLIF